MSDLYNRIDNLCKKRNKTITKMCKECGASRASLTDLKVGRKQQLSSKTLSLIAEYFCVTVDYLLGNETVNALQSLRDEDRALLEVAKGMTPEQVALMTEFARKMKGEMND